jgi:ketosteroid isomerase-like protein
MSLTPELEIRLARAAFNRALATADLDAIRPLLAPNTVLVTGTDSAMISGRRAQLAIWKQEFSSAERAVYVRTPDAIAVSGAEPIALEQGRWQGVSATDGRMIAGGAYAAKWRRTPAGWAIEAEIYVTMT